MMSEHKALDSKRGISLRERLSFLLKDSVIFGGSLAISKAVALITFPILARHLGVVEYGRLDYFLFLSAFLVILFVFGQDSGVGRYFFDYTTFKDRSQLITQSLTSQLVGLALFVPVFWFSSGYLTPFMINAPDRSQLFNIVLFQLPFQVLISFSQNLLRWTLKRTRFLLLSLGSVVSQAVFLIIAILVFDVTTVGILQVFLISNVIFGFLGVYFIREWLTIPNGFHHLLAMLPFALPYGLISVMGAFSPSLERTFTEHIIGSNALGEYAVAAKFALLLGLIVNAFQMAWGPFFLNNYKRSDAADTFNWVLKLFTPFMCVCTLLIALFAKPLITIIATDDYVGGAVVIFPLAMALTIEGISWITEIGIGIVKRSHLIIYAYVANYITTFSCIFFLAPTTGLLGVGIGVMAGRLMKGLIASFLAQRAYPFPWEYRYILILIVLTIFTGFMSIWTQFAFGERVSAGVLLLGILFILVIAGIRIAKITTWQKLMESLRTKSTE